MSTEKLIELSKPVAQAYYDEHDSSTMLIDWLVDSVPEAPTALYSQEYVSAMLARIAELEAGHQEAAKQIASWRRIAKQNIEEREKDLAALNAERQKIIGLEAKLATPVRLPTKYSLKMAGDKSTRAMFSGHNSAINDSADAVRVAGFKVEGDE